MSGDAEANFEKGYKINFSGSWALFEAIRQEREKDGEKSSYKPRFVFASSLAVIGPPFPDPVPPNHGFPNNFVVVMDFHLHDLYIRPARPNASTPQPEGGQRVRSTLVSVSHP